MRLRWFARPGARRCDWSGEWACDLVKVRQPGGDQFEVRRQYAARVRGLGVTAL